MARQMLDLEEELNRIWALVGELSGMLRRVALEESIS